MTVASTGQRGLVPHSEPEVARRAKERRDRRSLAGVVPHARRDGSSASCNSRHFPQTRDRIGHEVNDELRERRVELAVRKGQCLR